MLAQLEPVSSLLQPQAMLPVLRHRRQARHNFLRNYELKRRFVFMRHGEAVHNTLGILNGDLRRGELFPLTEKGKVEVQASVRGGLAAGILRDTMIIVTSAFLRARQSAALAARELNLPLDSIIVHPAFNERRVGRLEGCNYRRWLTLLNGTGQTEVHCWRQPRHSALLNLAARYELSRLVGLPLGLETTINVCARATAAIVELDETLPQRRDVLIVSHEHTINIALISLTSLPTGYYWVNWDMPNGALLPLSSEFALARFCGQPEENGYLPLAA